MCMRLLNMVTLDFYHYADYTIHCTDSTIQCTDSTIQCSLLLCAFYNNIHFIYRITFMFSFQDFQKRVLMQDLGLEPGTESEKLKNVLMRL